jgi:hypothetical protein
VRVRGAGKDHHAAGNLVQPVDDPYLFIFHFQHFQQIRRIRFPAFWEHGKPGAFINYDDLRIKMENVHRM